MKRSEAREQAFKLLYSLQLIEEKNIEILNRTIMQLKIKREKEFNVNQ